MQIEETYGPKADGLTLRVCRMKHSMIVIDCDQQSER